MTYVMEELGDARMRCDQLLRYIDKATKLIEKSSHKDHFFEVAGDVIRGIPETAFKMHKALQAVALAANRIDYEEIKQDLRPEKAEELERVLEDVRVRQVQRRSFPMLEPKEVVEQLRGLAKQAREQGQLDTDGLSSLIAALEVGAPKVADDVGAKAAHQLEAMAHALEHPPAGEAPSRVRLAQILRKTLAEHIDVSAAKSTLSKEGKLEFNTVIYACKEIIAGRKPRRNVATALSCLAKGCAHLGQEDLAEIIEKAEMAVRTRWTAQDHDEFDEYEREKALSRSASEDEKRSRFEEGKSADPTKNMSEEDAKAWKENTEEYGDKFKKEALDFAPNISRVLDIGAKELKKAAAAFGDDQEALGWLSTHVAVGKIKWALHMAKMNEKTAARLMDELLDHAGAAEASGLEKVARGEVMLPPDGLPSFSAPDAADSVQGAIESLKHLYRLLSGHGAMRPGAISLSFKEAMVALAQAAWHLNLPDVHAILEKAKLRTRVKSVDRLAFVEAEPLSLEGVDSILDNLLKAARFTKGYGDQANYERMFFNLIKVLGYVQALGENFQIPGLGILDRVEKILVPYAGGSRPMIAAEDEKRSRYEEGKPADPTENMSEEDAKEWKQNTEEYGDKFKAASERVAKKIPAPDDPSIVREIMDWHGGQGSNLYSVGSTWNAGRPVDADAAEEAYDELDRKKADDDALDAFREHLREHGVRVATDKESFGGRGRVYLHYVKGGTKRREGPLDPQLAKRRMVALMEDGSVSEADFERKSAAARPEDWKAAS